MAEPATEAAAASSSPSRRTSHPGTSSTASGPIQVPAAHGQAMVTNPVVTTVVATTGKSATAPRRIQIERSPAPINLMISASSRLATRQASDLSDSACCRSRRVVLTVRSECINIKLSDNWKALSDELESFVSSQDLSGLCWRMTRNPHVDVPNKSHKWRKEIVHVEVYGPL